jgi:hypothetical protein
MTKEELIEQFTNKLTNANIILARSINRTHTSLIWTMAYTYVCTKIMDGFITDMKDVINIFVKLVTPHIMEVNLSDILKEDNEHE